MTKRILAADIGGTHSRFAVYTAGDDGDLRQEGSRWLKTAEADSFRGLLDLLAGGGDPLSTGEADGAVFAVAGPVRSGSCSDPPNIPWDIDLSRDAGGGRFGRSVLINDFVAQAFATQSPAADTALQVLPGEAAAEGVVAVVGAGTGLGHAALVPDGGGGWIAVPAEKGHAAFPVTTAREWEFQQFLMERLGEPYLRGDTVVSGGGIAMIHLFLTGDDLTPEEVTGSFEAHPETLEWAARFYGRACRDYALTVLARGGVFIAGGLAARTPRLVLHEAFAGEFRSSPTMGDLLAGIPVSLITDQESGLWGAARYGCQFLERTP